MSARRATSRKRSYKGLDSEDRKQMRRSLLIEAGLELFGTQGYRATSVKMVCDYVNLTERYFYESFANREALLLGVYEALGLELDVSLRAALNASDMSPAERLRGFIAGFYEFIVEDKRRGRIMLFEILGISSSVDQNYQHVVRNQAMLLENAELGIFPEDSTLDCEQRRVISIGLVGATTQIGIQWALEDFKTAKEVVIDSVLIICQAVSQYK